MTNLRQQRNYFKRSIRISKALYTPERLNKIFFKASYFTWELVGLKIKHRLELAQDHNYGVPSDERNEGFNFTPIKQF